MTLSIFLAMLFWGAAATAANNGCRIALPDANVIRGSRVDFNAVLIPELNFKLRSVDWVFTGGRGGTRQNQGLHTNIKLVDSSQQYTVKVTAFSQLAGIQCQAIANVRVTPRLWGTTPTVLPDNEGGWGRLPLVNGQQLLGMERDRSSDTPAIVVPSPTVPNKTWENGYTVSRVNDRNGPNDGYYYIKYTSFKIDQETVINQWIKPGGRAPDGAAAKWFVANARCVVPANFVTAVMNHENSGSGGGSTGHFGLIRDKEAAAGMDPRTTIEDNVDLTQAGLIATTRNELTNIEASLQRDAAEASVHGNWPGVMGVTFWDVAPRPQRYSPCNQFVRAF
jgi:hypothetical protein